MSTRFGNGLPPTTPALRIESAPASLQRRNGRWITQKAERRALNSGRTLAAWSSVAIPVLYRVGPDSVDILRVGHGTRQLRGLV